MFKEDLKYLKFENNITNESYEERVGPPEELPAVIGRISMNFQYLEEELCKRIIQMLEVEQDVGMIIVSEMSFRNLVNLFSSLYHKKKTNYIFNIQEGIEEVFLPELLKSLFKCEELRNQMLHSRFIKDWQKDQLYRKKTTAKAKKGLAKTSLKIDIPYLFDISDYMLFVQFVIDESFIGFREKLCN